MFACINVTSDCGGGGVSDDDDDDEFQLRRSTVSIILHFVCFKSFHCIFKEILLAINSIKLSISHHNLNG